MESYSVSDLVTSVGLLQQTVDKLTRTNERMATGLGWVKNLLFAIFIAIVIGVGAQIIGHWIK